MAQQLLTWYVRLQAQRLTHIVRAGVEPLDWTRVKEPRNIRFVRLSRARFGARSNTGELTWPAGLPAGGAGSSGGGGAAALSRCAGLATESFASRRSAPHLRPRKGLPSWYAKNKKKKNKKTGLCLTLRRVASTLRQSSLRWAGSPVRSRGAREDVYCLCGPEAPSEGPSI